MSTSLVATPFRPLFSAYSHSTFEHSPLMAPSLSPQPSSETATFSKPLNPSKRASTKGSPNGSSPRPGKRLRPSPVSFTAAAALEDKTESARQVSSTETSPNPANQALNALMGVKQASSAAKAPNPASIMSEPLTVVAGHLQDGGDGQNGPSQTSPVSLSSMGTLEGNPTMGGIENVTVDSPRSMGDANQDMDGPATPHALRVPDDGPKSFSYPGPMLQPSSPSNRGMSLPGSESRSGKKHRCPYCETDFTRHHNLKSHLLTHSQEKPYVCQSCDARFRRLHDLKRHTKLHTGERSHICPKCGRKFARGDALARHNKGAGGCAGRRDSTGSFMGDGDYEGNGDPMTGLVYNEPEDIEDDSPSAQRTVPDMRRQASTIHSRGVSGDLSRQPSTYPPIQGRPAGGITAGLYPHPSTQHRSGSSSKMSPGSTPAYPSVGSSTLHPTNAAYPITESPRPLSPGNPVPHTDPTLYRNRSPSSSQLHKPSSTTSIRRSPTLAPLPPAAGINPPDPRYTLASQGPAHPPTGPTGPPTHMSTGGLSSQSNSLSSHGHSARGSAENSTNVFGPREDRLWAYVRAMEERINQLQAELLTVKDQLAAKQ